MNKQVEHYEKAGDSMAGKNAARAYCAALTHLQQPDLGYLEDWKRVQNKLLRVLGY